MTGARFTTTLLAGLLIRRDVRRTLMQFKDVTFREEKGWFDSFFVVEGPEERYAALRIALADYVEFD